MSKLTVACICPTNWHVRMRSYCLFERPIGDLKDFIIMEILWKEMWNFQLVQKLREVSGFEDPGGYEREVWSVFELKGGKMEG